MPSRSQTRADSAGERSLLAAQPQPSNAAARSYIGPIAPAGRFEFRAGDEIASLVDGVAHTGPINDPDVVVEGDAEGLYDLFIERRLDGVSISGDHAFLDHLIDAAPQPIVA